MRHRAIAWIVAVIVLALPPVDGWLDRVQPRLMLIEMPAWFALGWLAGRRVERRERSWNPLGLTGLAFFIGALGFWMIPRSVDLVNESEAADQLMHASLLAAGLSLSASLPVMPFVVRTASAIYGTSMIFALGMVYSNFTALLCGSFDLEQQRQTGRLLLFAYPAVAIAVVVLGARNLARERSGGAEAAQGPRSAAEHGSPTASGGARDERRDDEGMSRA